MKTRDLTENIPQAAALIAAGELVAVPTETVYGLAGNGLDEQAVERLYAVKGRPAVKPLSLMVRGKEDIDRYCVQAPPAAYALAEKFWPGPLTIVLKARDLVPPLVRAGGETVGLRCPDHPLTRALLEAADCPLAAPSANPSGAKSPRTAGEVWAYFDGAIAGVIDGGPCALGVESTLIDLSRTPYSVLRPGAVGEAELFAALRESLTVVGVTGGSGCGKTTALESLEALGALVIDCDAVYHDLTEHCAEMLEQLQTRFPGAVVCGVLQRKELGRIVFADPAALRDLNDITHRFVSRRVDELLTDWARQGGTLAAVDAIALLEGDLAKRCAVTVGVTAPTEQRVRRLMAREGISEEYARLRIAAQPENAYYAKHCDYVLDNSGTREAFAEACAALFGKIITEKE